MQSIVDPKIISRLQALLRMAEDGRTNEHEAQIAMTNAQELMMRHNLSRATVEAAGHTPKEQRLKDTTSKNLMFKWQRELFTAIAKVNFCHFSIKYKLTASGEQIAGGYDIIGRQSNVIATRNMYDYLAQTIARLVKQECGPSAQDQFTKYANSFRLGCVDRLAQRLKERHQAQMAEESRKAREQNAAARHPGSTSNALVVVAEDFRQTEEDLNEDLRLGKPPGTTAAKRLEWDLKWEKAQAERKAKVAELVASGISEDVAKEMSWGVTRETAEAMCRKQDTPSKPETPAQRAKREAREQRDYERRQRRREREASKIDTAGYIAGHDAGRDVGLDDQVTDDKTRKIGGR